MDAQGPRVTDLSNHKLYLTDPYVTSFDANVESAHAHDDGGFAVRLDRSHFYPESGGQLPDQGRIDGGAVIDVQEDADGNVIHRVDTETAPAGTVTCAVDWNLRFDHMQQHTGQHVLSRAFIEIANLRTVSFHMGDESCTIDLDGDGFENAAANAENLANRIIEENRPVTIRTVSIDQLDQKELRRKVPDGVTEVRLVEIQGFDTIPCCGTHVRQTGELTLIKVLKAERVKKKQRVYFKVGRRALRDYQQKHDIIYSLSNRMTTGIHDLDGKVVRMMNDARTARKRIKELGARLSEIDAGTILETARAQSERTVVHFERDGDGDYLKALSSVLKREDGRVFLLGAGDGSVVCVSGLNVELDLAAIVLPAAHEVGGNGGGKGGFVQIKLPAETDISAFLQKVQSDVQENR